VQRCGSQQGFQIVGHSDERDEIAANDDQTRCGSFATPSSSIGRFPFGRRSALTSQGEGRYIEIDADELPLGYSEGGQDTPSPAADLQDGASRFRRYSLPIS
jgi:hypothetical protein